MRGAWIEISLPIRVDLSLWSLPVRGAWIEINHQPAFGKLQVSLPVRGAWIEIAYCAIIALGFIGRSPCGERGLK